MIEHSAERKARGAFFTPPSITHFLSSWAVRRPEDRVLEPSCGEADFLIALAARQRELGAGLLAGSSLRGIELHAPSAEISARRIRQAGYTADIIVSDFFDIPATSEFDAVVGNPPYIRYQHFAGEARAKARRAALRHGVNLSGLASSWAAFVVHASGFLKPSGRLGLVLPAELLTVKYAAEVRRFLLRRFSSVKLILFDELVFPGIQEEVVLLLAEGTGSARFFEVYQARNADDLPHVEQAEWVAYSPVEGDKWFPAVIEPRYIETYHAIAGSDGFETLFDWGETYLGCVTGNNRFFTFDRESAFRLRIPKEELVRISPPGSRHLRGLSFSENAWEELLRAGRACYLFLPDKDNPSEDALRYIRAGETTGVHKAYKCRVRSPWWRVPTVAVADLFLTYMDRDRPRLISNHAGALHLNSLYGVRLHEGRKRLGMELLPLASLNSLTLLGAEIVGRGYGGGILKLEPREADRLPMPSIDLVEACADRLRPLYPQLSVALRQGDLHRAVKLVDRVLLIEGLGLDYSQITNLRDARETLFRRRISRSGRTNGTNR